MQRCARIVLQVQNAVNFHFSLLKIIILGFMRQLAMVFMSFACWFYRVGWMRSQCRITLHCLVSQLHAFVAFA